MKLLPESAFLLLNKERQHAYLLRAKKMIDEGNGTNCPFWLYFVVIAYFEGDTEEIRGTPTMSTYRDVLLNQLLP